MFGLRGVREWTFLAFVIVLLEVLAIYMQAAFILPDFAGERPVDLHQHYFGHLRWFFGSAPDLRGEPGEGRRAERPRSSPP